jgi:hypothetical protein
VDEIAVELILGHEIRGLVVKLNQLTWCGHRPPGCVLPCH